MLKWQESNQGGSASCRDFPRAEEEPAVSGDDGKPALEDHPKTVRCVIDRDFCDRYKKLGSGDFVDADVEHRSNPRREGSKEPITRVSALDSSRLKNHLEWKRQKEMEYAKRREAEKLEEQRKEQDKLREEKESRMKEKEREEKMKEWQKQKARKRQEREREESVFKALEQEIKVVTETIGKEKLIHEWIRLKNKQKQMEAQKKAELMKKEEESRALRQSLAEISYRQWKERTKTRKIDLPKNGYQIFGPKPVPVVKEDWNHDFIKGDDVDRGNDVRTPKSTASVTLIRASCVSRTDVCSQLHHQYDPKKRSPSSHHLSTCKGKACAESFGAKPPPNCWTALNGAEASQEPKHKESFVSFPGGDRSRSRRRSHVERFEGEMGKCEKATNFHSFHEDKPSLRQLKRFPSDCCALERGTSKLFGDPTEDVLPAKSRLDIYLKTSLGGDDPEQETERKFEKPKRETRLEDNLKKFLSGKDQARADNSKLSIELNGKPVSGRTRKMAGLAAGKKKVNKSVSREMRNPKVEEVGVREKPCPRSPSCGNPCQIKSSTDLRWSRSFSKSIEDKSKKAVKAKLPGKQTKKPLGTATVENPESKKKKKIHCRRKFSSVDGADLPEKHSKSESEVKNRKKTRMGPKSETLLIADSPYSRKRGKIKSNRKPQTARLLEDKDGGLFLRAFEHVKY